MKDALSRTRCGAAALLCSVFVTLAAHPLQAQTNLQGQAGDPRAPRPTTSSTRPAGLPVASTDAGLGTVQAATGKLGDTAPADEVVKPRGFDMSAVEAIRLRVPESADLNGEYQVGVDGTVSFPTLGRIRVSGMTPEGLERELSRKISILVRRDVVSSIEIVRFRDYYVMGMVANPGASEWRPGLNVIRAMALAGGTVRPASPSDDPVVSINNQQQQTQLQFSLALLARLKAERDGSASVAPSEQTMAIVASMPASVQPRLREFLDRQNAVLDEQRGLMNGQINGFERDRLGAENELHAAEGQEKAIKAQMDISQSLLNDVETLKDQKLVSNSRYLAQRSELITAQIRFAEAKSMVERAKARVEAVSRQIETLQRERKSALNERIETLQREVAQLEVNLAPAQVDTRGERIPLNLVYHIARETEKGIATQDATVFSEIFPGDVIVVSAAAPDAAATAALRTAASGNGAPSESDKIQKSIEESSAAQGRGGGGGRSGSSASAGGGSAGGGRSNARTR